ncbi:GUN4 domain-containing protein [Sodalinema gerasimenkoae]|uniref:GUN4 domain-containing protein n=1 Tax=Sodalinema gerasimenkoae TaxID=2862348 RepID=UPI0013572A37|nr:GUN4 domain-containing protein [Sodalinema gerasimenkoae]
MVDLSAVRSHLTARNWAAADAETRRILNRWIHPGGDILSTPLAANIPSEVLQTLDQLWVEASGGRFGFSVQQRIWAEVRRQHPPDADVVAKAFGDRVGWTRPSGIEDTTFVAREWLTEREINPTLNAPVGHLPWAGVSWEQIDRMLSAQSCGSCTIDAMYLQGERFHQYLPLLYNRVETALDLTRLQGPSVGSWQRPELARTIDLTSLYPNSQCPIRTASSAISPNGQRLATATNQNTLQLWEVSTGRLVRTLVNRVGNGLMLQGQPVRFWQPFSGRGR